MKKCTTCKIQKPLSEFYKKADRIQSSCKDCNKTYKKNKPNPDDWITLFVGEPNWMRLYFYE